MLSDYDVSVSKNKNTVFLSKKALRQVNALQLRLYERIDLCIFGEKSIRAILEMESNCPFWRFFKVGFLKRSKPANLF